MHYTLEEIRRTGFAPGVLFAIVPKLDALRAQHSKLVAMLRTAPVSQDMSECVARIGELNVAIRDAEVAVQPDTVRESLENSIDRHGLREVVRRLSAICDQKAERIRAVTPMAAPLANRWEAAAISLMNCAEVGAVARLREP